MNRRLLTFLLKLAVTAGLLFFVLRNLDVEALWRQARALDAGALVAAVILVFTTAGLHAWRWLYVFRALDEAVDYRFSLTTVLIGAFFNQTLPSAIGGDAVRVWRLHRRGIRFGHALYAVLLDRGAALVALLTVMACLLPLLFHSVTDTDVTRSVTLLTGLGFVGFFIFMVLDKLVARWRRWRAVAFLADLAAAARRLFTTPARTLPLMTLSIAIHSCMIAAVFFLFRAQDAPVTFWQCAVLVPPIILASMMPVSIAGWGVREGAMVVAFGLIGVAPESALLTSLMVGVIGLLAGAPGGVLFLGAQRRRRSG